MTSSLQHLHNPKASFWIEASAGTGKTKILVDRVINLLLAGCKADGLLCITFTKAAAAEMANRVRDTLSLWMSLSENDLRIKLKEVTRLEQVDHLIPKGRTLLHEVLRVPGGLHIQTIHGFCQYILKRFPLEAGVAPHFQVMDEHQQKVIKDQAFQMALSSLHKDTIHTLFEFGTIGQLQDIINDSSLKNLKTITDIPSIDSILSRHFEAMDPLLKPLFTSHSWMSYQNIFLTQKQTIRKKIQIEQPQGLAQVEAAHILETLDQIKHVQIDRATHALEQLYKAYSENYRNLKASEGLLDYDDLIHITANLLQISHMGAWVLFKLDQQLDHILVDEAQDTNQDQWNIIGGLVQEFYAGQGARDQARSIFVVGDSKQSIYSFQGADPVAFSNMRQLLQSEALSAGLPFYIEDLSISYRSASPVLQAVDQVFHHRADYRRHIPSRHQDQGIVEIWPLIVSTKDADLEESDLPLKPLYKSSPKQYLADKIATQVKEWLDHKEILASKGRPIEPRDIMILVRHRDELGTALIKSFKKYDIPMAGIDRLNLTDHILIQDLIAIAKWCLFPADDLLLATVLKGPFFQYSENDVFNLCYQRPHTLWYQLENTEIHPEIRNTLKEWKSWVNILPPYEFFSQITVSHQSYLKGRFGQEGEDILQEFLITCLKSEHSNLTLFLEWFDTHFQEIKRDFEQAQENQVRILTVHGSKGLQAPIVFLPDTTQMPSDTSAFILEPSEAIRWVPKASMRPHHEDIHWVSRDASEYQRLLYVAMTRAEDRLYICGASTQELEKLPNDCWYKILLSRLESLLESVSFGHETRWRLESPQLSPMNVIDSAEYSTPIPPLPDWYTEKVATEYVERAKPSDALEDDPHIGYKLQEKGNIGHDHDDIGRVPHINVPAIYE